MQHYKSHATRNMLGGAALAIAVVASFAWLVGSWSVVSRSGGGLAAPPAAASTLANSPPPRIVALAPGLTETLRRIGIGSKIVGRHGFDAWTDPTILVCGDQGGIDAEMLRRANPTHLYLQWGDRQLPSSIKSIAADQHWIVRNFTLLSLDQIQAAAAAMYTDVRATCDTPSARAALGIDAETFADSPVGKLWQSATAQLTGDAAAAFAGLGPIMLLYSDREPVAAAGPGSYHHEILTRLGCRQAILTGAAYQVLDRETLRRTSPAIVVVLKPRKPVAVLTATQTPNTALTEQPATNQPATNQPALRRALGFDESALTRVVIIDDPLAFVPGLNLIDLVEELKKKLLAP